MFKQLRNKFLILNITIITVVMLTAFVAIYLITYARIQSENKSKLDVGGMVTDQVIPENNMESNGSQITMHHFSAGDALTFTIEVDENGGIISVNSLIGMSDETYQKAASLAWSEQKDYSILKLDGHDWMYAIKEGGNTQVMVENGKQTLISENGNRQIVFLDVTDSNKTLFGLLVTCLIVGFMMLFVITAISLYFTGRAIRPIREAWDKQKQFVADASHELKTPLAIINANADALLSNEEETIKSQRKWLDYIKEETNRMGKLIGDLLYLAKVESPPHVVRRKVTEGAQQDEALAVFDISRMVNDIMMSMEAVIYEKGIKLTYQIEPNILIRGNEEKIHRVVVILLDNAVKYTEREGCIDIALMFNRHGIEFKVKNTGNGIPADQLPFLFDRFYRADPSRNSETGGYGLGLPIAKAIIDKAGGRIYAESVEHESTTFRILLKK